MRDGSVPQVRHEMTWRALRPMADLGWRRHPCRPGQKLPILKDWPARATRNGRTLGDWLRRWPGCNWAVATGPGSAVFVLDIDRHGVDGGASLAELERRWGTLPATVEQHTGGGGRQLFFAWPEGRSLRNSAGKLGLGIDTRAGGGYVVVPPSLHPSGNRYTWHARRAPGQAPLAAAPRWLLDLLDPPAPPPQPRRPQPAPRVGTVGSAYAAAALRREIQAVGEAREGSRNATLNAAAFKLGTLVGAGALNPRTVAAELLAASLRVGLSRREAEATILSGLRAGAARPREVARHG